MTTTKDAALLRELAAKMTGEAAFAINTGNMQNAAQQLRHALSCLERIQAAPNGFNGYSINATNAAEEFKGYDLNNPTGEKQTPVTANAGRAGDDFANYDMNAINKG